ncbi:hypothetical protein VMT65_01535 [Nocardia sp. CDC153]|uniref:hypothetical protein n=1 Tax=Nocardia sp. CDC153 TaxID=3112167 RepID=UPI002DBE7E5A|nr:hypothetical protein [Nocardia sp. CDC153]MEC3951704.1 hypothetical protein [Nocardia sp. CDC153]
MALTEVEAKTLGALCASEPVDALTVRQIRLRTGLGERSIRHALSRLARTGLVLSTRQWPTKWRSTDRGRLAVKKSLYREFIAEATPDTASGDDMYSAVSHYRIAMTRPLTGLELRLMLARHATCNAGHGHTSDDCSALTQLLDLREFNAHPLP